MGSAERDDEEAKRPTLPAGPTKPDRRAEALRANLKRRKVQARGRAELGRDRPERDS